MGENILHWYQYSFWGIGVRDFIIFFLIVSLGLLLRGFISNHLGRFVYNFLRKKTENIPVQDFLDLLRRPFEFFIVLLLLCVAFNFLNIPLLWEHDDVALGSFIFFISRGYQILLIVSVTWILLRITNFFGIVYSNRAALTDSRLDDQLVPFFKEVVRIIIVIVSILVTLSLVFKLNVLSIITGLGIGGIAVALAGKETLENLFASFTIFLDKPFVVGDLVQVGNITGTVEQVGFRSTRIRTLEKSFLTLPNKLMIDQALDNLTLRTFRRAKFNVGLPYGTPTDKIKEVVAQIQTYLNNHPRTNQESLVRFMEFGSASLEIMVLCFVDTIDFVEFTSIREELNYKIIEIVNNAGCDFAPSAIVHCGGGGSIVPNPKTSDKPLKP